MHQPSPDHTVVTFVGPDATAFLQSQLTNDVAALSIGSWQWQGYCSAKGRLYATFALARTADDAFTAVVHSSVAPTLVKRLIMFRLRSKLAIEASTTLVALLHLAAPGASDRTIATIDLSGDRWITVQPAEIGRTKPVANEASTDSTAASFMQRWNLAGIEAMQPEITAATSEMFVPQMIGWDTVQPGGGVSFNKGCYPGQEVVARAHYRGAVKRHLELQRLTSDSARSEGVDIMLADGRNAVICNMAIDTAGAVYALTVVALPD
jgi:tRNA-modifying protein YgfZ